MWKPALAFLLLILACAGCAAVPPQKIPMDRRNYLEAVSTSWKEQLLSNLVKQRYGETLTFLEMTSINTSYSLDVAGSANFSRTWNNPFFHSLGVGGSVLLSDRRTIFYASIRGEALSKTTINPIGLSKVLRALQTGWHAGYLLSCCVKSINNLRNRPDPTEQNFFELAQLFRELMGNGVLRITIDEPREAKLTKIPTEYSVTWKDVTGTKQGKPGRGNDSGGGGDKKKEEQEDSAVALLVLDIERAALLDIIQAEPGEEKVKKKIEKFKNLLWPRCYSPKKKGCEKYEVFKIFDGNQGLPQSDPDCDKIVMRTRSIMQVIKLLSHFVDVPRKHINEKRAIRSNLLDSELGIKEPLNGKVDLKKRIMFEIKWSKERPKDTFVVIEHRGYWFYVDDKDHDSKEFFSATEGILSMSEPGSKEGTPVLTLPVH